MIKSTKQVHASIPRDMHQKISDLCPDKGQKSTLIRKLFRAFLRHMDIEQAGKTVAESWREED